MPYVYPTDILIILSRLATHYQLCVQGGQTTSNKMCIIDNKQSHLQERISLFEHQADSFLLHQQPLDTSDIPAMEDYDQYDHADDPELTTIGGKQAHPSSLDSISRASDGSGMEHLNPEDYPITLPSSLGWDWCIANGAKSLTIKEAKLHHAQANGTIHHICIALGFKSALFHTQVHTAKTQQTKTVTNPPCPLLNAAEKRSIAALKRRAHDFMGQQRTDDDAELSYLESTDNYKYDTLAVGRMIVQ
jgi:hypothetical protein